MLAESSRSRGEGGVTAQDPSRKEPTWTRETYPGQATFTSSSWKRIPATKKSSKYKRSLKDPEHPEIVCRSCKMETFNCICLSDPIMNELNHLELEANAQQTGKLEMPPLHRPKVAKRVIRDYNPNQGEKESSSKRPCLYPQNTEHAIPNERSLFQDIAAESGALPSPETRPFNQADLVREVKEIYAGLILVEMKCVEIDSQKSDHNNKLSSTQWKALIALHKTLLREHHDFFLTCQHPSASPQLRSLAAKYSMPSRLWQNGINGFLELLQRHLPGSLTHMLDFVDLAISTMEKFYRDFPSFGSKWTQCQIALDKYSKYLEELKHCGGRPESYGTGRNWNPPSPFGKSASDDYSWYTGSSTKTMEQPLDFSNYVFNDDWLLKNASDEEFDSSNFVIDEDFDLFKDTDEQFHFSSFILGDDFTPTKIADLAQILTTKLGCTPGKRLVFSPSEISFLIAPEQTKGKGREKENEVELDKTVIWLVLRGWLEYGCKAAEDFDIYVRVFVTLLVPCLYYR